MAAAPMYPTLTKAPTGITGFDQVTGGGLPEGRTTLVCGGTGCGKTLFAMEFLIRGITEFDEPGVFIAFEETREELTQNFSSLGFDLENLSAQNKLLIDHIHTDWDRMDQTGEFDLDALLIRLDHAIQKVQAKRVVLDTVEVLFDVLGDTDMLRSELRRVFRWLKERGVTVVITGESGDNHLTRRGIEAYISDCVILLEQRIDNKIARRWMRIIKYRGSHHGTDEYPFLVDTTGLSVLPITSVGLEYPVSEETVSSGIERLDSMLAGRGFFRSSTILISGESGSGKTSMAAQFVDAACRRGERCLFFSFEEPAAQIIRNVRSVGINLREWVDSGLLRFKSTRPTMYSLEMHLTVLYRHIQEFAPQVVILDPVTSFDVIGSSIESRLLLTRMIDFLKTHGITAMLTSLTRAGDPDEQTQVHISSMIDTWILVNNLEANGERNRILYILKSRGMAHSNQICEFEISEHGINILDAYTGTSGVLTGAARIAQEAHDSEETLRQLQKAEMRRIQLDGVRTTLKARIAALQARLDVEEAEMRLLADQEEDRKTTSDFYADTLAQRRGLRGRDHLPAEHVQEEAEPNE
ncbi:MAG: circadian clock protein KaiC [Chloroflexi bacterium]|nr:circadian clock protein KaiC [Chloroflexota bacterium]